MFVLSVAVLLPTESVVSAEHGELVWDVTCRVPDVNSVLQIKVSQKDVTVSENFGQDISMLEDYRLSKVLVFGDRSSLLVSQMSVHALNQSTYRMEWWNTSNPSLLNSLWTSHRHNESGEISINVFPMNCRASKSPNSYSSPLLHVFSDTKSDLRVFGLDEDTELFPRVNKPDSGEELSTEEMRRLQQEALSRQQK